MNSFTDANMLVNRAITVISLPRANQELPPLSPNPSEIHPEIDIDATLRAAPDLVLTNDKLMEIGAMVPEALGILNEAGVGPLVQGQIINPWTGQVDGADWRNVGQHNFLVGLGSRIFAQELADLGLITAEAVQYAQELGSIHDMNKRLEVLALKSGIKGNFVPPSEDRLMECGFSPRVIQLLHHFDNPSGGEGIHKFMVAGEYGLNSVQQEIMKAIAQNARAAARNFEDTIVRLIVRTVDDMLFTTSTPPTKNHILTAWERLRACEQRPWYPRMWAEGIGVLDGAVTHFKDVKNIPEGALGVFNFALAQVYMANSTAQIIQALVEPASTERPEEWAKDLLTRKMLVALEVH